MRWLAELWYPEPPRGEGGEGAARGARRPPLIARCALVLLQPLAWAYAAVIRARRGAYERGLLAAHTVGRPVVVVGNLTVGGTGKTPLVVWLAAQLGARGLRVGIVSRGYGRRSRGPRRVRTDSRWEEVGDEPLLLKRRTGCAVAVAEDRVAAARLVVAEGVDLVLSDDGLQHLRLARDFEILVLDGARGLGRGRLLPAGPLREPASRALQADFIVVNGSPAAMPRLASLRSYPGRIAPMQLVLGAARRLDGAGEPSPLASFAGTPVHAVAAIGHPARFFESLAARGLHLIEHAFADHHPFSRTEIDFPDDFPILMTEKDAMRCAAFATPRMWYVPVDAQLERADATQLIESVLARIPKR